MSGQLSFPAPRNKRAKWFARKPRTLKDGEVRAEVFDVYRIIKGTQAHHVRVYTNYSRLDDALAAKNSLQLKTGDTCYVVSRNTRRMKKSGTRQNIGH